MASTISDDLRASALAYHRAPKPGKLEIQPTKPLGSQRDLALAYSPGVAAACEAIGIGEVVMVSGEMARPAVWMIGVMPAPRVPARALAGKGRRHAGLDHCPRAPCTRFRPAPE